MGSPITPSDCFLPPPVLAEAGDDESPDSTPESTEKRKFAQIAGRSSQSPSKRDRVDDVSSEQIPPPVEEKPKDEEVPFPSPDWERSPERTKEEEEALEEHCERLYRRQLELMANFPEGVEEEDEPCCCCCGMDIVECHEDFQGLEIKGIQASSSMGPNAAFTPLLNFKENHQFHHQLRGWAEKAVSYFNNKNDQNLYFEDVESLSSSTYDDTVYLLTINVRDTWNGDLKILQAEVSSDSETEEMEFDCSRRSRNAASSLLYTSMPMV